MKHLTRRDSDGQLKTASASSFLWAGCGFGGSCFPKDVKAIAAHADNRGVATPLLDAVLETNRTQPDRMVAMLKGRLGDLPRPAGHRARPRLQAGHRRRARVAGAADHGRAARDGAEVMAHDPIAIDTGRTGSPISASTVRGSRSSRTLPRRSAGSEAVVLVTSWPQYREVPALLKRPARTCPWSTGAA